MAATSSAPEVHNSMEDNAGCLVAIHLDTVRKMISQP